jgi:hypothetical protein
MLVSCLVYSSTLKIEAIRSSELSVHFHRNTWRYIPEERTLHEMVTLHWCPSIACVQCIVGWFKYGVKAV